MTGLRGISVRQPYAEAVASGAKRVENRSRPVRWSGEVAIHAGLAWHRDGDRDSRILVLPGVGRDLPRGVIVAVAQIVDCHLAVSSDHTAVCCEPWGMHTYNHQPAWHIVLDQIRRLPRPVPCKGLLTIGWPVPADVENAVRAQLLPLEVSR